MNQAVHLQEIEPTNPLLNQTAQPVRLAEVLGAEIQGIIAAMLDLAAGKGRDATDTRQMVGLAAPQVGVSKRIIIIDSTADGSNKPQNLIAIINPRITYQSTRVALGREGCWSCGTVCGAVERAQRVTVAGVGADGQPLTLRLHDFVARIAQHEVYHLRGIRFPDRIPLDKPERLHAVLPHEFPAYRKQWANWPTLYPREQWLAMKSP